MSELLPTNFLIRYCSCVKLSCFLKTCRTQVLVQGELHAVEGSARGVEMDAAPCSCCSNEMSSGTIKQWLMSHIESE